MDHSLRDFTGLYSLSETLSFELRPLDSEFNPKPADRALADMKKYLDEDRKRAAQYASIKAILDEEHKKLIERVLSDVPGAIGRLKNRKAFAEILSDDGSGIRWSRLKEAEGAARNAKTEIREAKKTRKATSEADGAITTETKEEARFKDLQKKFRELIAALLDTDEKKKSLLEATPSKYIKGMLSEFGDALQPEVREALETFEKFACYLKGFQENRANLYAAEPQVTAVANRVVNQNFPKFLTACRIMAHIQEHYPAIISDAERNLAANLNGAPLMSRFRPDAFDLCLAQSGIDVYNTILGGFTLKDGTKIQGINETINLYRQQHADAANDRNLAPIPALYKQILSDRDTLSFIPEMFDSDRAVCDSILKFLESLKWETMRSSITSLLDSLDADDPGVFVEKGELTGISHKLFGDWSRIRAALERCAETKFTRKADREKWLNKDIYSLRELNELDFKLSEEDDIAEVPAITDFWRGAHRTEVFSAVESAMQAAQGALHSEAYPEGDTEPHLRENENDVAAIKDLLDALTGLLHLLKPLQAESPDANMVFYADFNDIYARLDPVIPLYNRVRNYITRKPSDQKKVKLMFNCSTLADGWDRNKESDNNAVILLKDGNYYLAVIQPAQKQTDGKRERKVRFADLETDGIGPCFRKMVYKYLPGPNKMLPKVIFSKSNRDIFDPPAELLRKYEAGMHKKTSPNFDLKFCRELIDFFKVCIAKHEDWSKFGFQFADTAKYNGIDEFYNKISAQGYKMTFAPIPVQTVSDLIRDNKILLFHIYNKDFAPGATGRPNKFTLYWKTLFEEENLKDVVFKLNGEAELFLRDPSVRKPFVHRKGDKLVNRTTKDGAPVSESVHAELCKFANGRIGYDGLSAEARGIWDNGQAVVKTATHDITKDRRFTMPKFLFHVPISINFKAPDAKAGINQKVLDYLRDNPGVKVIGIDRGERNLVYLSLIGRDGRILLQKSFNTVPQRRSDRTVEFDYHAKLDQREKERDAARKNWTSVNRIKDLKAGYLSQIVHEIAKLMVEHNAVVVMEDLNFGFKRGRFAIEKQVYQNFERALITKLNYLVFKDAETPADAGYVLKGLQLANKFESFEKLGKQSGFLFYVPAGYTSKIDPATGFVSLFQFGKYTSAEARKAFLGKFRSIRFDAARDAFAFTFDYRDFPAQGKELPGKSEWTVRSVGERIVYSPKKRESFVCKPTEIILDALAKRGIRPEEGFDLLRLIRETDGADRANAAFFNAVFEAFKLTVQMRNSDAKTGEDYILSPVMSTDGVFFDSRKAPADMPRDADANGAYHIAMKGLYLLQNRFTAGTKKADLKISNQDWFDFIQNRHVR